MSASSRGVAQDASSVPATLPDDGWSEVMTTALRTHDDRRRSGRQRRDDPPQLPTAGEAMSRNPAVVDARTSLFSAWGHLHGERHRHLVVIDEAMHPVGVLDERDIALEWPPGPIAAHHLPVEQLLRFRSRPQVRASTSMAEVAGLMVDARTDALPVVDDDGRLQGLVTVWQCAELVAAHPDSLPHDRRRTA